MRYSLRTLLILLTIACILSGWYAYIRKMAAYHRDQYQARGYGLISKHPSEILAGLRDDVDEDLGRANDFDHAFFRPWLAFYHFKPGSIFAAPEIRPRTSQIPPPIVKRLRSIDETANNPVDEQHSSTVDE